MPPLKRYFITNGQFLITTVAAEIYTVLGSCVSVCLWDKQKKMGGMNHYLMPGSLETRSGDPDLGYSSTSMLIRSMLNRGASMDNLEAKIFGGCNSWASSDQTIFSVGKRCRYTNYSSPHRWLQRTKNNIQYRHWQSKNVCAFEVCYRSK